MGLNHREMHFTDAAAPYIELAGGKMGGLYFLGDASPLKQHILPMQIISPGERLSSLTVPSGDRSQYIVRGSHPFDFQGLVDVLATEVGQEDEVGRLVQRIQREAQSSPVMEYARYENSAYDGNIFIGIQPYIYSQRGSLVEHPNQPGRYVVSFVNPDYESGMDSAISGVFSIDNRDFDHLSGAFDEIKGGEKRVKEIVDLYRQVEEAGLVKPGISFQMEFLNTPSDVYVAQVRAFKKKQQVNFEIDAEDRLVFGVTPKEGIVLPVYLSVDGFIHSDDFPDYTAPWAYLKPCEPRKNSFREIFYPKSDAEKLEEALRFHPENMAAYLIGQSFMSQVNTSLEHNHLRIAQKADITVFEGRGYHFMGDFTQLFYQDSDAVDPRESHNRLQRNTMSIAKLVGGSMTDMITSDHEGKTRYNAKIISDGRTAIVKPVKASD